MNAAMTISDRDGSGRGSRRRSATAGLLQRLAPYVAVAALAYPVLIWPLFEAEVVSLQPMFTLPTVDQTPSTLLRAYFSALVVLGLASFCTQPNWRSLGLSQPLLLGIGAVLAWAGATTFWAVEPEISFRRFFLIMFVTGSIVSATLAARDHERLLRIGFWMFAVMVVLNVARVLTTPPTALGHAGIYPHKNYFAAVASIMMLFALYQVSNGTRLTRLAAIPMLLAGAWFLIVAQSKTSIALIVFAPPVALFVALIARHIRISPAFTVPLITFALYGIYEFGVQSDFWDFYAVAYTIFGDPTLTLRTDIWAFAVKKIAERPWLGYGYEVFWGAGLNSPSVREGPGFVANMPHAHNGYLDIVLHTGFVGLGIFVVLLMATLHQAGRLAGHAFGVTWFILSLVVFCLLYNCFESTWFRSFNLISMVFVLAIVLIARLQAPMSRRKRH
jgi:exopolysaccharide production protein ExoQ